MSKLNKFKVVAEQPEELSKGEFLVQFPTFVEEIRDSQLRISNKEKVKLTENRMLRNALVLIGMRYDKAVENQDPFNAFAIPLGNYEGLPYRTEKDISKLLVKILTKHAPKLIDDTILTKTELRPSTAKTVVFFGPEDKAHLFTASGFVKE